MERMTHNPLGRINAGYLIVSAIQFPNAGDWYLWRVMGKRDKDYVLWTYNIQDDGFAHGHYFTAPTVNNHQMACREMALWYTEQLVHVYGENWKSRAEALL